jgi:hypothetical protein
VLAAIVVFFARTKPRGHKPDAKPLQPAVAH